ncbi:hypothetical protein P691DRAFT_811751 [Macrolepiota fuliginosa MF-IS2]|uniref:Uncharacterized protein n=1 Tax=Macrolepiota fuliginosa MF-IS2 TaxID=1400762 RepID=A0A9P5XP45_9AGAR|nr:hypothetical protein P691DRAFT_811751 [Macrolepiota fuliginosa MF-IS2]
MMFISAVTTVLAFFMLSSFSHNAVPWLLVTIQTLGFMRTLWSITRKSLVNSFQSVASEGIGLFSLFPFYLILALIVATTEFRDKASPVVYMLLQTFVIGGSVIHIIYTICLVVVAMITVSAFDGDVWIRDIDSSPSPFPIPVLLGFICPGPYAWLYHRRGEQSNANETTELRRTPCLSPCACPSKPEPTLQPGDSDVGEKQGGADKSRSFPHKLVRVPDAAQQRALIVVSFDGR